ncbi:hypothetical protein HOY80DRAFT_1053071 [Tuber brumale]|nr:hypothetical protein HOY80DRAFT_1053071 [Tuber brumale]
MPPTSEEEKVLFLISCVRNTGDGKTNWKAVKAVCEERGILNTQAASKRWVRLSNANPVGTAAKSSAPGEKASREDKAPKGKKPPKEKKAGASPRKRRKTAKEMEAEAEEPQPTTGTVEDENEAMKGVVETNEAEAAEGGF